MFTAPSTVFETEPGAWHCPTNAARPGHTLAGLLNAPFAKLRLGDGFKTTVSLPVEPPSLAYLNLAQHAIKAWDGSKHGQADTKTQAIAAICSEYLNGMASNLRLKRLPPPLFTICTNARALRENSEFGEDCTLAHLLDDDKPEAKDTTLFALVDRSKPIESNFAVLAPWARALFLNKGTPEWELYHRTLHWVRAEIFPITLGADIIEELLQYFDNPTTDEQFLTFVAGESSREDEAASLLAQGMSATEALQAMDCATLDDYRAKWGPLYTDPDHTPKAVEKATNHRTKRATKALEIFRELDELRKSKALLASHADCWDGALSQSMIAVTASADLEAQQDFDEIARSAYESGEAVDHLGVLCLEASSARVLARSLERLRRGIQAYQLLDQFLVLCTKDNFK